MSTGYIEINQTLLIDCMARAILHFVSKLVTIENLVSLLLEKAFREVFEKFRKHISCH